MYQQIIYSFMHMQTYHDIYSTRFTIDIIRMIQNEDRKNPNTYSLEARH